MRPREYTIVFDSSTCVLTRVFGSGKCGDRRAECTPTAGETFEKKKVLRFAQDDKINEVEDRKRGKWVECSCLSS
jgi:hypothetical protein